MAYGAAFLIGGNHDDMCKTRKGLFQSFQPLSLNTVIIGQQNRFHGKNSNGRDEWI